MNFLHLAKGINLSDFCLYFLITDTSVMDTEKPIKDLQLYDHDEVYDLPNIHESDDHMQSEDKENLDFMSDLRHRRVN